MEQKGTYRHELKYLISFADYLAIRQRIRPLMKLDENASKDGKYLIRSIYFDNADDKALREKKDGVQKREKFRIRYYNDDFSYITLEKKMKHNSLCLKLDAVITEKECRKLLVGDTGWMITHESDIVRELYCKMNSQQLRPRVLVSYIREPYVYEAGNVRVTFDRNITSSKDYQHFFDRDLCGRPIMPLGHQLLEVKYDEYIPDHIYHAVQLTNMSQTRFSKYQLCMRIHL